MNTIKQILQHHHHGRGIKWISRAVGVSKNTVRKYIGIVKQIGRPLDELLQLDDPELESVIHPETSSTKDERFKDLLGRYEAIKKELSNRHVTRFLLWTEYKTGYPGGYSYSQFCWHLQQLARQEDVSAVIHHEPGDLLYIDFAGKTMDYIDVNSGEIIPAQIFIATLGYSQYSYVEALSSQQTEEVIGALNRALVFFGAVPKGLFPDNFKGAVIKADRYEPSINQLLEDFANHYQMAVIPARVASPKDKSLVETMVNHAYNKIYAPLRHQKFYSLAELNEAIRSKLSDYHQGCFQGRDYSRAELFAKEKSHLSTLPSKAFEIKKRRQVTVQKNAHVSLREDQHYYSVPFQWIGHRVTILYTRRVVTIYAGTKQIASHVRGFGAHQYTTVKQHLPSHLQHYMDRSPAYYQRRAAKIAPEAEQVVKAVIESKRHPEQGYKSCDGVLALARKAGQEEFINACRLALEMDQCNYGFIKRVIENGMASQQQIFDTQASTPLPKHPNTRGKYYYQRP